mmetsp:Transcript_41048/g.64881  ORF Transcript_41048/g.64881 Transcript_41048/m.64881 type:complete len:119 (+) Transcript_41048:39-395(+)
MCCLVRQLAHPNFSSLLYKRSADALFVDKKLTCPGVVLKTKPILARAAEGHSIQWAGFPDSSSPVCAGAFLGNAAGISVIVSIKTARAILCAVNRAVFPESSLTILTIALILVAGPIV